MKITNQILQGYENTTLIHHNTMDKSFPNSYYYDELGEHEISGVLKASRYVNGRLLQTYSKQENHVGVIAATRLGKTSQYVIPTILSFAKQKVKKRMVISDPKGELYKLTSEALRQEGYTVKLINFRDYQHSEYWNPLTPIFKKYKKIDEIDNEVEVVNTKDGPRNRFRGRIYESQEELDYVIEMSKDYALKDVENDIDTVVLEAISTERTDDPYWEDSARVLLKGLLWAMLEDSSPDTKSERITEETFSYNTALTIMDNMRDDNGAKYNDGGYFTSRPKDSKSLTTVKNCIIENGHVTRKCIVSTFNTKMSIYKDSTIRLITSCNSFDIQEVVDEEHPVAYFIAYRDEIKGHYQIISSLVQNIYMNLIEYANKKDNGKLDVPFYFILDEFGNFPKIPNFETVVSACAGRNIWFILILQSYAQLDHVYKRDVSEIIRDNLNLHVFIGSNNPETLKKFSEECGEFTRISPMSALNGSKEDIEAYELETIPLMPKSRLASLNVGECIVTEANSGYVLLSKLERYYLCKEFQNLKLSDDHAYAAKINPLERKYVYKFKTDDEDDDTDPFDF